MILSAEDLSYSYGDRLLFENITFNVEEGDKYGIIGVNGTGKSTLLRMIANHEAGDGKLTIPGGVVMEYLPQDPPFEADATVLEQVFKGDSPLMVLLRDYETAVEQAAVEPDNKKLQKHLLDLQQQMDDKYAWQLESEAKAVLTQLGITNLQQQMGELSGGQRKRVALAGVLAATLSACVPLVVGTAVGGAWLALDRRTSGAQLEDEGIEYSAKEELHAAIAKIDALQAE